MSLRLHLALSRTLLCAITLWVLVLCWRTAGPWDERAAARGPLAQGKAPAQLGSLSKAHPPLSAPSAPARRALARPQGV